MSKRRLIYCRAALNVNPEEEELSEIERIRRGNDEDKQDFVWGKCVFLIDEIVAVLEHWPTEGGPAPDQCNITLKNSNTWGVDIPYEELKALIREYYDEGSDTVATHDVGKAVAVLSHALATDPELYYGYQSNIAMAFKDEYSRYRKARLPNVEMLPGESDGIHEVANNAAKYFLDLLIKPMTDEPS